ncbi:MAG: 23S rRNA (uridine(2552)-2'-O)-methyltransferase RlmE [Xanthomonadales bacterium]|nr:23S rRNA (uridine(2552)-2'-O)-methyltransferase RlmE [Xanthomonadales bacterium]MCB1640250.1 23S rRNA (uridine(2552)-2'-O)-methyltransferase RlmE [Xanthomonadales bacterium]
MSGSSQRWLREHFKDPYVQRAQREGMRSRAAFKLEELLARDRLLRPDMVVVDLGAAPGGWSQVVADALKGRGRLIALDILPMAPLDGVEVIEGDFTDSQVLEQLLQTLDGQRVDLVLSDIAPNMSGVAAVDQSRSMYLAELALDFARGQLTRNGALLIKLFQGEGFDDYLRELRSAFAKVVLRKPKASRGRSREIYALATGFKAG